MVNGLVQLVSGLAQPNARGDPRPQSPEASPVLMWAVVALLVVVVVAAAVRA